MTKLYSIPYFVKEASSNEITGADSDLSPSVYGDPRSLKFPCHNSPATYVSMSYFLDQEKSFGKASSLIKKRIIDASDYFGIRPAIDELIVKHASMQSHTDNDLSDSDFAIVSTCGEIKSRNYPLRNSEEIKIAAQWVEKFANDFCFQDRKTIAKKILDKSLENNLHLENESELRKMAADGFVSFNKVASMLFDRAKALKVLSKDLDTQELLIKAAKCVLNKTIPDVDKAVAIIDSFDKHYGISSLGSARDLYSLNVKVANEILDEHVQLTNGSVYKKASLDSIKLDELRDVFGEDFADRISSGGLFVDSEKLAEELATFPRNDANLFDKIVSSSGINTVYKQASGTPLNIEDFN